MRGNEASATEPEEHLELEIERGDTEETYRALVVRVGYRVHRTRHDGIHVEANHVGFLEDGEQIPLTDLEMQVVEDMVADREATP